MSMFTVFNKDIQRIGDELGLKGSFCCEWGFNHIMESIRAMKEEINPTPKTEKVQAVWWLYISPRGEQTAYETPPEIGEQGCQIVRMVSDPYERSMARCKEELDVVSFTAGAREWREEYEATAAKLEQVLAELKDRRIHLLSKNCWCHPMTDEAKACTDCGEEAIWT